MRSKASNLEREVHELPSKLEQHKARDEEQMKRTLALRQVIEKKERVQKGEIEQTQEQLEAFQKSLGLTIRKKSTGELHFRFTHIDDTDLNAQFEFALTEDDSAAYPQVHLVSCIPPLEKGPSIIESYNHSQHPQRLSTLVRLFRREFLASLATNRV